MRYLLLVAWLVHFIGFIDAYLHNTKKTTNLVTKRKHRSKKQDLPKLDITKVLDSCRTSFTEGTLECIHYPRFVIFINVNKDLNYVVKLDININLKELHIFVKPYTHKGNYYIPNKTFTYNIGKSNWRNLYLVLPIFFSEVRDYIKEYLFLKPKL